MQLGAQAPMGGHADLPGNAWQNLTWLMQWGGPPCPPSMRGRFGHATD